MIAKPIKITPLKNYRINIEYADNVQGVIDLSYLSGQGVFKAWDKDNIKEFEDLVSEAGYYLLTKYIKDVSIIIENFNDYKEYTEYIPFYENIEKEGIIIYG